MVQPNPNNNPFSPPAGNAYHEDPERLEMSRHRWENNVRKFLHARNKSGSELLAWFSFFASTIPVAFGKDDFSVTLIGQDWHGKTLYFAFFIVAAGMLLLTFVQAAIHTVQGIAWCLPWHSQSRGWHWIRWQMGRPNDWVPTNVGAFVEQGVREIEAEERAAARRQLEAVTGMSTPTTTPQAPPE